MITQALFENDVKICDYCRDEMITKLLDKSTEHIVIIDQLINKYDLIFDCKNLKKCFKKIRLYLMANKDSKKYFEHLLSYALENDTKLFNSIMTAVKNDYDLYKIKNLVDIDFCNSDSGTIFKLDFEMSKKNINILEDFNKVCQFDIRKLLEKY